MYKTHLRDLVKHNKTQFELTNNNNYIIEATITYAIYNALGGKKLVPLPPFTDALYTIIYNLAIVRIKIGKNITADNISKAEAYLIATLHNIKAIEYINNGTTKLKLYTIRGVYLIDINDDIALALSKIAAVCINETCDTKTQTMFIQDAVYKHFINIGRA